MSSIAASVSCADCRLRATVLPGICWPVVRMASGKARYPIPSEKPFSITFARQAGQLRIKRQPQAARELQPRREHDGQKSRQLKSEARSTGERILECYRLPVDISGPRLLG